MRRFTSFAIRPPVCLVVGAGDATGSAIARSFSADFTVCLARRSVDKLSNEVLRINSMPNRKAFGFGLDARIESEVVDCVAKIEAEIGPIEVCIHNIGANVKFGIHETTSRVYTKVWEMVALSSFLVGREVSKNMAIRKKGTIIFTGATASLRGGAGFSAFSGAMHAKRALAQSMARELGPQNIHVAHVILDGAVDTPWIRSKFPEMAATALSMGGLLEPDAIAENYLHIHRQPPSAWTHELDLRPFIEKW